MKFRFIGMLALLFICAGALNSNATMIEQVKKDFAPVSGCVVMPAGNEYIIDLDAVQGITAGDLLAVIKQGKAIVHPLTHKVLGTLDKTIAVLQVTRVKSGYSYAKKISGDTSTIKAGTKLQRYSGLSAVFSDKSDAREDLFAKLKAALPALQWQNSNSATIADLFFNADERGLQVRDSKGQLIRSYTDDRSTVTTQLPVPAKRPSAVRYTTPAPATYNAPLAQGAVTYEQPLQPRQSSGVVMNMEFPRFTKIGQFGATTIMADFETVNDQLLLATTDGGSIQVFTVANGLQLVAKGDSATFGQILAISWYQPQPGTACLCVTVWSDDAISCDILQLQGNRLIPVVQDYSQMLAGFDVDGDGRSELLLGQEFIRDGFYGKRVSKISLHGSKLSATPVDFAIPHQFRIFGSMICDISGDGKPEVIFTHNRRLYIYSGEQQIYKSSKELGASISTITYAVDPDAQNPMLNTASCEVAPVGTDLDGDGIAEIVAIAAEGNIMQSMGVASAIDKTWLAVFKYRNGMVMKGTLGDKLERPLQGVSVANGQAYMVATDVSDILDKNEATYVLAIPVTK